MKRIRLLAILCLTITSTVKAQEKELDCDFNFREALFYLKGDENFKKDSLKSIEFLKPCLKIGDAKAQLLMARLYTAKKDEKNYKKAFKLLKKSAKQGNAIAAGDLGVLYKYGRGCNLNFNKARRWFKKAAELGNDKASYSLGYLFLKGFGNIDQDYSKAVKWFKKSKHPMAKYWLGVCYYYGYGIQQDIIKANELLGTNFESITNNNENTINTDNIINEVSEQADFNSENTVNSEGILENTLFGKWSGSLLKYDWSGKHIEHKHLLNIEFKYDSIQETPIYSIIIEGQELTGNLNKTENYIYFEDVLVKLPHTSFNERIPNELVYEFLSTDLNMKNLGEATFLIGNIDSYISDFNESGAPLKLVLRKKETFANSNEELSDDVLQALAEQEENFIKLYPNPFESDLVISYTLEAPSFVEVKITDINGTKNSVVEKGKEQKAGKHSYFFNGNNLEKGIYIVTVITNNQKKTRIIVKK